MFCTRCGKQVDDGAMFCPGCGSAMNAVNQPVNEVNAAPEVGETTVLNAYNAPNNGYGAPNNGYGAPNNGYGAPNNGYGAPNNGYGAPNNGYGAPNNGYGAPNNGYGAPNNGYGAPNNGYGAPNYGYGAPNNGQEKKKLNFAAIQAHSDIYKGPEKVDFGKAAKLFALYALNFKGRSSKSEYWWGVLVNFLASMVLNMIPIVGAIASLALMVPAIAMMVRRLHDIGKSGWYYLMGLIPLAGPIILLVYCCKDSQPAPNQWGPAEYYTDI